ncbi:TPA: hypothetical protein N0F65_005877 [Lagenidium giganteum]|uniref:Uncharacterized protein n=1 Tax=Lagenidium giganteum TaxID=4803 RepID=A0AAV2YP39_9STRA|nr:TPA: hypothetical protein N0F65_005877 [Lagenidium giganteum]
MAIVFKRQRLNAETDEAVEEEEIKEHASAKSQFDDQKEVSKDEDAVSTPDAITDEVLRATNDVGFGCAASLHDLRRVHDGIRVDTDRARQLFNDVKELAKPTLNAEKICDIHNKMLTYVPIEYYEDSLYAAPSAEQQAQASTTKKSRRTSNSKGAQ